MGAKCSICDQLRILLVTGAWVCDTCDRPMPSRYQEVGAEPTWKQKQGIDPAEEWLDKPDDERK